MCANDQGLATAKSGVSALYRVTFSKRWRFALRNKANRDAYPAQFSPRRRLRRRPVIDLFAVMQKGGRKAGMSPGA